jgi:chemotaxis response regulator CheB
MKKILIALALIFAVGTVQAADGKDWKGWYNNMLKGLKTKISKRMESKQRVSAVAAVRGAKQGEDPSALYWKGGVSEKAQKKLADEKNQLTAAVELVVGGDIEGGRAAINKFLKENPESFFAQDARDALDNLPAAEGKPAEAKPAETKPAETKPAEEKK